MAEKKAAFVEHEQPPLAFIDNEGYYSEDFETDVEDQSDDDGSETVTGRMREGIFSGLFFLKAIVLYLVIFFTMITKSLFGVHSATKNGKIVK